MIPVTKPFLPAIDEYTLLLKGIWERQWLTNQGPLVIELEKKLQEYLKLENLVYVNNGTIALQLAIKALDLKGEIITTPFSFVATTSSIVWEGCTPVFADIDSNTCNIDPNKIEALINKNTSAILATHCFGNACDIDAIQKIADQYKLKVIYDAAHCFGTLYKGKSIFEYGDISTTSFHSTKLFHTIEGGAVFTRDKEQVLKLKRMRNFGHDGPEKFNGVGINGKNSEFHAAMGICNLKHIVSILANRKLQYENYLNLLLSENYQFLTIQDHCQFNFAYFPMFFKDEDTLLRVKNKLEENAISPRRYFYPSLDTLEYLNLKVRLPISDQKSKTVLCLPLYYELKLEDQIRICTIINSCIQ